MSAHDDLAELERQLLSARRVAEAAADRAAHTGTREDYDAAMEAAQVVEQIWQAYSALWHHLHPPTA